MMWTAILILILFYTAYMRLPLMIWTTFICIYLLLYTFFSDADAAAVIIAWSIFTFVAVFLNLKSLRRSLFSDRVYAVMKKVMPNCWMHKRQACGYIPY